MQNNGKIKVKRGLNSAAKPWNQLNYNLTFEINGNIIDGNIHCNYSFFTVYYTDNWKPRCVADIKNDFKITSIRQPSF